MSCIFCDIVSGALESSIVYRDTQCTAFMDIQPVNPGHVLIIPNRHAAYLADLVEEEAAHLARIGHRISRALRHSGLPCEGINHFLADGEVAMQEVFHVHLHIFPRVTGDGFGLTHGAAYFTLPPRSELRAAADRIAQVL